MKKVAKSDQILKKVKALPKSPGVYLMKNARGGLLYIGKAKSLRVRVGSYFLKKNIRDKTTVMIQQVRDIDHIQTPSEIEAWIADAERGMENALKAKPNDIREQYEQQIKELTSAYGEAMLEMKALKKLQALLNQTED